MSVIQREAPQSAIMGVTEGREELEAHYAPYFDERLGLRQFVTYVPNKKAPIHRWFQYKEGFSYKLVETFLREFGANPNKHRVFDPFVGCGTTLIVAQQMGFGGWGIDILPVAVFVSRVKLRQADEYNLADLKTAIEHLRRVPLRSPAMKSPQDVRIIRLAYDLDTLDQILFFKEEIQQVEDIAIREFLLLGLMAILEKVSYTSKDGQYLRLKRNKQIPSVRETLITQLEMMFGDLIGEGSQLTLPGLSQSSPRESASDTHKKNVYIAQADARSYSDSLDDFADIIITSPPYLNRYDYSRIYSLELCLEFVNEFEELKRIRHSLLRSHIESREAPTDDVHHPALTEILDNLAGQDLNNPRIPVMIKGYFEDMNLALKQMARTCRPGATVALVVANARFHGELIPVDLLLSELALNAGFAVERIIITRYKGNSSQQMGRFGRVAVRESIAVWKRK
ncbi:MAG: site-specific DNA-methyltransferase [Anaerolineae bacterium]